MARDKGEESQVEGLREDVERIINRGDIDWNSDEDDEETDAEERR
jgi:hypothetical protein